MVTSIAPHELEALSGKEPIDIIDVREPSEWSAGHVPGARLIPLAQLKADPAGAIPRDRVVFVCAKGGRSAQAAQIAERLGRTAVYNLTGGTDAWRLAGLAVVVPSATPPARDPKAPTVADADASELVEPSLDGIVAQNLRALAR